jgi:hypothetical protein
MAPGCRSGRAKGLQITILSRAQRADGADDKWRALDGSPSRAAMPGPTPRRSWPGSRKGGDGGRTRGGCRSRVGRMAGVCGAVAVPREVHRSRGMRVCSSWMSPQDEICSCRRPRRPGVKLPRPSSSGWTGVSSDGMSTSASLPYPAARKWLVRYSAAMPGQPADRQRPAVR